MLKKATSLILITITFLILGFLFVLWLGSQKSEKDISNFEECSAAGNPVMESYPRQCAANGQTFTEVISPY